MGHRILVVCDDLLFWSRIRHQIRSNGGTAVRVDGDAAMERAWHEGGFVRLVADLEAGSVDVLEWAARWKARPDAPQLVGFSSHVDADLQERARTAGFDQVLSNSRFARDLARLV